MSDAILVLDARASSLQFSLFQTGGERSLPGLVCSGECAGIGERMRFTAVDDRGRPLIDEYLAVAVSHEDALVVLLGWLQGCRAHYPIVAAGHRVLHGGTLFTEPIRIDSAVTAELRRLVPLAPREQRHNLAAIAALSKLHPYLLQVACFETAFHRTLPPVAAAFALPRRLAAEGVRRYGFDGLAYECVADALPALLGSAAADGRIVVAHLAAGTGLCALQRRASVAATTGFSTLDGVPGSRSCGRLDPGVVLYLLEEKGMSAADVSAMLHHDSGLLGMSGISDDLRELVDADAQSARDTVAHVVYAVTRELGSLAAVLGGIDALVFTGAVGEQSAEIRRRVCDSARWLGIEIDAAANAAGGPRISRAASRTAAWIVPSDERLLIARRVATLRAQIAPAAFAAGS